MSGHQGYISNPFAPRAGETGATVQTNLFQQNLFASQDNLGYLTEDPHRTKLLSRSLERSPFVMGFILHAIPSMNWYRVQLEGGRGILGCFLASPGSTQPFGPKTFKALPVRTLVFVYLPPGLGYGLIIASVPEPPFDPLLFGEDFILQAGMSGLRQEAAHLYPIQNLSANGDVENRSCGLPRDLTSLESGIVTPTGLVFSVDDFLIQLRVNELCGLWLNYLDGFTRLAGTNLLIESAAHEEFAGNDNGETYHERHYNLYPWEAIGLLSHDSVAGASYGTSPDPAEAFRNQDDLTSGSWPQSARDVSRGSERIIPVNRHSEYNGFLGQGGARFFGAPVVRHGVNLASTPSRLQGLFSQSVSAHGEYQLWSAKGVILGRRANVPIPVRRRAPEDPQGDDVTKGNYRPSGLIGDGPAHNIGEVKVPEKNAGAHKMAAADDTVAYARNWTRLHPFAQHANDFDVPEESDSAAFAGLQQPVDYSKLKDQAELEPPAKAELEIDHRYGKVVYYSGEQVVYLTDDGGVLVKDASGSAVRMNNGNVRIESAGDLILAPGRNLILQGNQVILRAQQSVDLSASLGDVRLKAEKNLHMLGGNSGLGGVLIESKSKGQAQDFQNKIGEDVTSSGIVLLSPDSGVQAVGGSIYLRSGPNRNVVLDADQGKASIALQAESVTSFVTNTVNFAFGPTPAAQEVKKLVSFAENSALIDSPVVVTGGLTLLGSTSTLLAEGDIVTNKNVTAVGVIAQRTAGPTGQTPSELRSRLTTAFTTLSSTLDLNRRTMQTTYEATVFWAYGDGLIGNEDTLSAIGFSFRDSPEQYQTQEFVWPQRYWEQIIAEGRGFGADAWEEKPVNYQGAPLYPWPGKKAWVEDACFLKPKPRFRDPGSGNASDRATGAFNAPGVLEAEYVTMAQGYKVIRTK